MRSGELLPAPPHTVSESEALRPLPLCSALRTLAGLPPLLPPPSLLPALWAPVGLRYHALHHLLPGVPYHNLGEAHRRVTAALEPGSPYHKASYKGLPGLVNKIVRSTMTVRR